MGMNNPIIPYGPLECRPLFGVILAIFIIQSQISVEKGQLGIKFGPAIKGKGTDLLPVQKEKRFLELNDFQIQSITIASGPLLGKLEKLCPIKQVLRIFDSRFFHLENNTGINILVKIPYFFPHLFLISSSFFSAKQ